MDAVQLGLGVAEAKGLNRGLVLGCWVAVWQAAWYLAGVCIVQLSDVDVLRLPVLG